VIDTSSSMHGEKLDMVKSAVGELHSRLRDTDILGIVTLDSHVRTLLKATPRRDVSTDDLARLVGGLQADGATDLNLGLLYGIDELQRHADGRTDLVNCLYLFSDGDPTSGVTDWIKIRTNVAARVRGDLTLSCFGFGSDARMRELAALAGLTGGHSTFVLSPEDVRANLLEDLARRESLAAINIQLQVEIDPSVAIWHLYGHDLVTDPATRAAVEEGERAARRLAHVDYGVESLPSLITRSTGIRIFAPDLAFGETYWVVFELEVPSETNLDAFGRATVQYVDTVSRTSERHELELTEPGAIPHDTVLVHAIGLWTSEVTFYALDDLYQDDRETAKSRLSNHVQILKAAYSTVPDQQFRDDQITLMKLISLSGNLGTQLSWTDQHGAAGYTLHAMNRFGQVRGGFIATRLATI
jgi:uncharacterized protein YegL